MNDIDLDFPVTADAERAAKIFCHKHFRGPVAAIFGICRFGRRAWPAHKTAAIADRLALKGLQPWLVYGPGQAEDAKRIADQMQHRALLDYEMPSFPELRAILGRCELFFGNDGGPKHAAVAAGIPTITLYSSAQAIHWAPANSDRHRVISTHMNHAHDLVGGRITDAKSIEQISIGDVWNEISNVLRQLAVRPKIQAVGLRHAA